MSTPHLEAAQASGYIGAVAALATMHDKLPLIGRTEASHARRIAALSRRR